MKEIPPMTDPLGIHWEQPDRSRILIDETHALMSRADMDALHEYSTSIPTGTYSGKMWKRQGLEPGRRVGSYKETGEFWLCWYGDIVPAKNGRGEDYPDSFATDHSP